MPSKLKGLASSVLLLAAMVPCRAAGGHREGNGGDYIRATFIDMGRAVIRHLKMTRDGAALATAAGLDPDDLADLLSIDVVKVSDLPLSDNGGSAVDALGEPGRITLSRNAWFEHFEQERDVYFLVLHEMLRAKGIADDNYVVSGGIRPFPAAERIATSIASSTPLVGDDDVGAYIDISKAANGGSGCPSGFETFTDFDAGRNAVGIRYNNFDAANPDGRGLGVAHKNCIVVLTTRQLPANKRLVVAQIDVNSEVNLPPRASATFTGDAYTPAMLTTPSTKIVHAGATPLSGRMLLRSNPTTVSTACGSGPTLLDVSTSATVTAGVARVLGATVYLKLAACGA